VSLDRATVGRSGYREIFQSGETLDGRTLIDHQHPHDLLMQAGAVWRYAVTDRTGVSIGGGPVGEPALGPVAFMHRPSAAENPTAPLGHHTYDSTHISMGVINLAVDHGPWVVETSLFNGREPDEQRWDLMDPGALDSWSGRVWFQPGRWQFQASHGFLHEPEALEPGDVHRSTVSMSWFQQGGADFTAVTALVGRNSKAGGKFYGFLTEATRRVGWNSLYFRIEVQDVEAGILSGGPHSRDHVEKATVATLTVGGVRDVLRRGGFELGIGGDAQFYAVPQALEPTHGSNPISLRVFLRLRPPAPAGRMWNMRMPQAVSGH
jgi:hypothetical protein